MARPDPEKHDQPQHRARPAHRRRRESLAHDLVLKASSFRDLAEFLPDDWSQWSLEQQLSQAPEIVACFPVDHPVWKGRIRDEILGVVPVWAVGVTTAPRYPATIGRTLQSLEDTGWDRVHVFSDGYVDPDSELPPNGFPSPGTWTSRCPAVGAFGNWWLALHELVQRTPAATHFLLVQDDAVFCRNVRQYCEQLELPGIVSLYRSARHPGNRTAQHNQGSGELFTGALALMFSRGAVRRLLASDFGFGHTKTARPKDHIDGALGSWCNQHKIPLWIHAPSLVQHIGATSTLGHDEQPATSFPGEEFDATDLLPKKSEKTSEFHVTSERKRRIGLMGFNTAQGLGYLNRDLARQLPADRWLIVEHSRFPMLDLPERVDCSVVEANPPDATLRRWLEGLDAVIWAETAIADRLPLLARQMGVRTVCVPMWEGLPLDASWIHCVDQWIAPTKHTYADLVSLGMRGRIDYQPWPIDCSRFPLRTRERLERYVFAYGNGGHYDRKGGRIVAEAARLAPDVPLIVYDQTATHRTISNLDVDWPSHVDYRGAADDPADLYREGDCLIAPSRWEGLGLQLLECQAAGMPLITTDAPPMAEANPWLRLPAEPRTVQLSRPVPSWDVSPETLAEYLRYNLGRDIREASIRAETWSRSRDWSLHRDRIRALLRAR